MKAACCDRYGPPEAVQVRDLPRPAPGPKDVLVKVRAASVTSGDARIRAARFPRGFGLLGRLALGIRGPRRPVLGNTFAGAVEEVGADVTDVIVGDRVAGMTGARMGTHAEYVVLPAAGVAVIPDEVSDDEAAGVLFGGTTALHFLHRRAELQAGQSVLVNGASGAVGTNAVQLARHRGAVVTAVCSGRNADLVRDLGAVHVHDHTLAPATDLTERFDVVLDAVGNLDVTTGTALLKPGGVLLLVVADLPTTLRARGRVKAGPAPERAADYTTLLDLVAEGHLAVVLEPVLELGEIVAAHRTVDSGHKRGNVIVRP